jgi:hypothetical protein
MSCVEAGGPGTAGVTAVAEVAVGTAGVVAAAGAA